MRHATELEASAYLAKKVFFVESILEKLEYLSKVEGVEWRGVFLTRFTSGQEAMFFSVKSMLGDLALAECMVIVAVAQTEDLARIKGSLSE